MQSLSLKEKKKPASSLLTQSHLVFCQNSQKKVGGGGKEGGKGESLKGRKKAGKVALTRSHLVFCQNGLAGRRRGDETAGAHDGVVGVGVVLDEPAPSHTHVACSDLHKRHTGR